MSRTVVFRAQAEDEALDVRDWYEERRPGLGDEFAAALHALVQGIAENPPAFPSVLGKTRRAVLTRFPYAVYFRETDEEIVVLAIHGRQDPKRWQGRQ